MRTATLLGIPYDAKSSFARGSARAPDEIRAALHSPAGNAYSENQTPVLASQLLRDAGNVALASDGYPIEEIRRALHQILDSGSVPLVLGGDHSISYAVVRAFKERAKPFSIIHFDAHSDMYDEFEGDRLSHACPFARIMEEGLVRRLVQVGIRCPSPPQQVQIDRFGVEVVDMRAWARGIRPRVDGPCYISVDLDVLDPAFAPGVSHREPGGLSTRELLTALQDLRVEVVGADIVELNPTRDLDGITAATAAKVLREVAALIWAR